MSATVKPWLGAGMLAALGLVFLAHADDPTYRVALVWLTIAVGIAGVVALLQRRAPVAKSRTGKASPVTVCVDRPLLPVPTLKHAYLAMPDHCRVVLGIGR